MAWGAAVAGIAALAASGMGAAMSANQASIQRKFIREMDNTKYQRTMADMKLAGLNPILVSRQSPTSAPAGAMATTPDFASAAASAAKAGVSAVDAATKKKGTTAAVDLASAQEAAVQQQEKKTLAETEMISTGLANARARADADASPGGQQLIKAQRMGELMTTSTAKGAALQEMRRGDPVAPSGAGVAPTPNKRGSSAGTGKGNARPIKRKRQVHQGMTRRGQRR